MHKPENHFSPSFLIFGCLFENPAHGYEIHQRLETDLKYVWSLRQSQLYTLLKRLEKNKLILGEIVPQEGRPDRKLFSLSPTAKKAYHRWLHTPVWVSMRALRMELLSKIYFLSTQEPEQIIPLIEKQVEAINQALVSLGKQEAALPIDQSINKIALQIKQAQIEMMLESIQKINVNQFRSYNEKNPL